MQTEIQGKQFKLADLLAGVTAENTHTSTDWGRPVGKERLIERTDCVIHDRHEPGTDKAPRGRNGDG